MARYTLALAPHKKLSRKMILEADARYKAKKYGGTQKAAKLSPNSEWAIMLLDKGGV